MATGEVQALVLNGLGETPALGGFPAPLAGDGTVEIAVRVAGLNPFDVVFSGGGTRLACRRSPLWSDARESGSTPWAAALLRRRRSAVRVGGGADLVGESHLFELRPEVDDATAVALGAAGISAWIPLAKRAAVTEADTVVVLGATGGVGRLAVRSPPASGPIA